MSCYQAVQVINQTECYKALHIPSGYFETRIGDTPGEKSRNEDGQDQEYIEVLYAPGIGTHPRISDLSNEKGKARDRAGYQCSRACNKSNVVDQQPPGIGGLR